VDDRRPCAYRGGTPRLRAGRRTRSRRVRPGRRGAAPASRTRSRGESARQARRRCGPLPHRGAGSGRPGPSARRPALRLRRARWALPAGDGAAERRQPRRARSASGPPGVRVRARPRGRRRAGRRPSPRSAAPGRETRQPPVRRRRSREGRRLRHREARRGQRGGVRLLRRVADLHGTGAGFAGAARAGHRSVLAEHRALPAAHRPSAVPGRPAAGGDAARAPEPAAAADAGRRRAGGRRRPARPRKRPRRPAADRALVRPGPGDRGGECVRRRLAGARRAARAGG